MTEEHISLLMEPGGNNIEHFTPVTGRCRIILEGIVKFSGESWVSMNSSIAMECDGTNVNTGINGGLIVLMEHYLERPHH